MRRTTATLAAMFVLLACQTGSRPAPAAPGALIYFQRAPVAGWQSLDWSGAIRPAIGSDHVGIPYQSPDGSRLVWSPGGDWQIVDRLGKRLAALNMVSLVGYAWADDSSGLCVIRVVTGGSPDHGGTYQLTFVGNDGRERTIASIAAGRGPNVAACSPSAGRAVLTTASGFKDPRTEIHVTTFGELLIVDYRSGAVVRRQPIPAAVQHIVVSHDGAEAAFSTTSTTDVLSLADGRPVTHVPGVTAAAFSWDLSELAAIGDRNQGRVVGLPSGDVLWSDATDEVAQGAVAEPRGNHLMFAMTTGGLNDLVVVGPRGVTHRVASNVFLGELAPCSDCSAY